MTVFTCEDNFDAMMTCVYEAWASRLGHSNIKLKTEPIGNLELFCDYRHVDADPEKTASVVRSIKSKISYQAYIMIYEAAISDAEDKLDTIYYRSAVIAYICSIQLNCTSYLMAYRKEEPCC